MFLDRHDELDVNGKTIVVRLTQWDLVALNVGFMPRVGALWAALLLTAGGAGLTHLLVKDLPGAARAGLVLVAAAALMATLASMAGFLFAVGVASSSPVDDPLRDRSYTFQPEGLRAQTGGGDVLIEWHRVRGVRLTRRFILIDVAPGLYHALPRRSFRSLREYRAFWSAARRYTSSALSAPR